MMFAMNKKIQKEVEEDVQIPHEVLNQIYPDVHYSSGLPAEAQPSSKLNLVIIGHVDSGKSTLMGHLLF